MSPHQNRQLFSAPGSSKAHPCPWSPQGPGAAASPSTGCWRTGRRCRWESNALSNALEVHVECTCVKASPGPYCAHNKRCLWLSLLRLSPPGAAGKRGCPFSRCFEASGGFGRILGQILPSLPSVHGCMELCHDVSSDCATSSCSWGPQWWDLTGVPQLSLPHMYMGW